MVCCVTTQRLCIACIASVSARVRRESWEESNNFRAITRLETLATQARLCRKLSNYGLFTVPYFSVRSSRYSASYHQWRPSSCVFKCTEGAGIGDYSPTGSTRLPPQTNAVNFGNFPEFIYLRSLKTFHFQTWPVYQF